MLITIIIIICTSLYNTFQILLIRLLKFKDVSFLFDLFLKKINLI